MRLSVVMGLHLNVPESQLSDAAIREHRNRVWWTAYCFDRMWAINLGNPVAAPDDVIDVDLPSNTALPDNEDFSDAAYYIARIRLAQLSGRIVQSVYIRKSKRSPQETTLSQRVQGALKDLHEWGESLPRHLHIDTSSAEKPNPATTSLHLSFNQVRLCYQHEILRLIV